jgi:hypothetical protein
MHFLVDNSQETEVPLIISRFLMKRTRSGQDCKNNFFFELGEIIK